MEFAEQTDLAAIAAAFGQALRGAGLPVTPERSGRFAASVQLAQPSAMQQVYWLARVTLVSHRDQIPIFDRIFDQKFRGVLNLGDLGGDATSSVDGAQDADPVAMPPVPPTGRQSPRGNEAEQRPGDGAMITTATPGSERDDVTADDGDESLLAAASTQERLGVRDFAELSDAELVEIDDLITQLPLVLPLRSGRRRRRARRGTVLDLRATLRRSHRSGGDPVRLIRRRREPRPRRLVLLADVSGSMEPYARVYLHLLRGAVVALRAEAFVFATRLTRLTRPLAQRDVDIAYRSVAAQATDWSGGTRLGASLMEFIDRYGRRGMARGAVIVVVSDGWEIGNPEEVAVAMERLRRLAHRIIWVNPRQAAEGYQPLVGGMAAALPHVDTFISGHSLDALGVVVDAIGAA